MKPRIFIDSGGWYLAYYLGMWEYILEHFGKEAFRGVYFDGTSAGGLVASCIVACVYGNQTMKYWLDNGPKQCVQTDMYRNGQFAKGMYNAGYFFYNCLSKQQRLALYKYLRFFCLDTNLNEYCCDKISNANEHANACAASGNIPFICSDKPVPFRDKYLWDASLTKSYYSLVTKKSLCISFHPGPDCHTTLDLSKWIYSSTLLSLIPCFLPQQTTLSVCDALFEFGYHDAKAHSKELLTKFRSIGIKL